MNTVLFTVGMCVVWAVALLNGTGIGNTYHVTEYVCYFLYAVVCLPVLFAKKSYVERRALFIYGGMAIVFVSSSYLHGHGLVGLSYLVSFALVAVVSRLNVREKAFRLTGVAFAFLGMAILAIFDYGTALSGWNTNSIAMIGLFSYLIFASSVFATRMSVERLVLIAVTVLYCVLIIPTGSRSCMLSIIAMLLLILFGKRIARLLRYRSFICFCLLVPLFIAVFVSLFSMYGNITEFNAWSIEQFGKPLFNGRDTAWINGFGTLFDNFFFGTGEILSGVWHNSAISCLTAYGAMGYVLWIVSIEYILRKGQAYCADRIISGCMIVFLLINVQQSFELGMFAPNPSLLIYLPLGIILGRIKFLKGQAV